MDYNESVERYLQYMQDDTAAKTKVKHYKIEDGQTLVRHHIVSLVVAISVPFFSHPRCNTRASTP